MKRKIEDTKEESSPSQFPPPFSSETFRHRILTGTMIPSGGQKGSLTRCVQKFVLLNQSGSNNDEREEEEDKKLQSLKQELQLYQMELTRLVLLQQNLEKEIQENDTVSKKEIQQQIKELSDQVETTSAEADRARQVESCFLEYEALAKLANSKNQSSSRQLRNEIEKIQQQILEYEQQEKKLDQILKIRQSQFQLLIQHMHDLKRSLDDTEEEGEGEGHIANEDQMLVENDKGADDNGDGLYGDLM